MKNTSISKWAQLAIHNFPESHRDAILAIANYALGYATANRIVRSRRPQAPRSIHGEIPYGHYINGAGSGTWKDSDRFFASLQFMYRHGWVLELDSLTLTLALGEAHDPRPKTSNPRRRDVISGRIRRTVYSRDDFTCWICGFETLPISQNDNSCAWSPSLDHIIPHSQGGGDTHENLATAHRWCNTVRGDRTFSRQIMNARVNCRRSGASAVREALEIGWEVPKVDLVLLHQDEPSMGARVATNTALSQ